MNSLILISTSSTVPLPSRARMATIQMTTLSGMEVMMSSHGLKSSGVGVQTTVVGWAQYFWYKSCWARASGWKHSLLLDLTHTVGLSLGWT